MGGPNHGSALGRKTYGIQKKIYIGAQTSGLVTIAMATPQDSKPFAAVQMGLIYVNHKAQRQSRSSLFVQDGENL